MAKMTGYHWAVTGAAVAFTIFVALDFGIDVWATQSGLEILSELVGVALASVLLGAYSWVVAFLAVWPLFLLMISLAERLKIGSPTYSIFAGPLTGALFSLPLLALPNEGMDQRSVFEIAMRVVPLCMFCGASGAGLFWWKIIRGKSAA
jgi:hypothetical protein